jgi:hypothetical protein
LHKYKTHPFTKRKSVVHKIEIKKIEKTESIHLSGSEDKVPPKFQDQIRKRGGGSPLPAPSSSAPHHQGRHQERPRQRLHRVGQGGREQGGDCLPGWRSLPDRRAWVPAFIRMIGEPDRLARLCAYSLAGLRYERAPVELLATVERAFALPGFDRMMIEALADQSTC